MVGFCNFRDILALLDPCDWVTVSFVSRYIGQCTKKAVEAILEERSADHDGFAPTAEDIEQTEPMHASGEIAPSRQDRHSMHLDSGFHTHPLLTNKGAELQLW